MTPRPEELITRARQMISTLAERAPSGERERRIPEQTIADMHEAGFFRVLQTKRWGGFEMSPRVFLDIQLALAEGDMSTAWVYGNLGSLMAQMAMFDERAAHDVWGNNRAILICCSTMRGGIAKPVEGGFRLSGRWRYLSGCDHCDWAMLGGKVVSENPRTVDARLFLVPCRDNIEFLDNWHVAGLRATGSQDAVINDFFVPDYRTHTFIDNLNCTGPGLKVNTSPVYRIPFGQVFFRAVSTPALGGLQAMLTAFLRYGAARVTISGSKTAEDPSAQLICAEAAASIDEMKTILHRNLENLATYATSGELPPLSERMRYKFHSALVAERCSVLAARMFKAAGAGALFDELPFGRLLADINAARQHIANQFEVIGRNWGATLLGLESGTDFFL
jgi:3-hydroxy-9,10-secoandrosta-1,3,5(10)-triene-9,17-dione monooxygenase